MLSGYFMAKHNNKKCIPTLNENTVIKKNYNTKYYSKTLVEKKKQNAIIFLFLIPPK